MAHSPGPWRRENDPKGHRIWIFPANSDTSCVANIPLPVRDRSNQEQEDNAKLIEVAPELLEALQALLKNHVTLVESGDCGFWDAEKEDEVIKARSALKKATGATD